MRHESQKTLIAILREGVGEWRKRNNWSRETVVQCIVEDFESRGGPAAIGIEFDPPTRDTFKRAKANADKVMRWLDDETKDNNLIPPNFIEYLLHAMPADIRNACLNDHLASFGLGLRSLETEKSGRLNVPSHLRAMLKEESEKNQAITELMDGADLGKLQRAHKEISEAIEAQVAARVAIESEMVVMGAKAKV
jgi:hypothetical protein